MLRNILGILMISSSLSLIGYLYLNTNNEFINPLQKALVLALEKKQKSGELPKEWSSIKEVKYKFQSVKVQALLGNLPVVSTNPQGKFRLEITFMDEPGSTSYILAQFNLIQISNFNLKYEFFWRHNLIH